MSGKDFVDREVELNQLFKEVSSGKSVVIYSDRRMGKSSLLAELSRIHSKQLVFARIDLYGMTEKRQLLKAIIEETSKSALGPIKRMTSELVDLARSMKLGLSLSTRGEVTVHLSETERQSEEPDVLLDFPEKVFRRAGHRVVIVFDEFQEIANFGGVALLKLMRSKFQMHTRTSYIFSGSRRHLLHEIFEEREGAFFKFARPLELGPISSSDFEPFIVTKFRDAGGKLQKEVARRILEITQGHPYFTQQVAHELFDLSTRPSEEDVLLAVSVAIEHQSPAYSAIWESIKSPLQRRYLLGMANRPSMRYGYEFVERYQLKTASNVQRVEALLTSRGIVDKGAIVDPMFVEWLKRMQRAHAE